MEKIIIDIETIPNQNLSDDVIPQFDEGTVKVGNLKDQSKIDDRMFKAKMEFEHGLTKKMSLESNYAQILSLGYILLDEQNKIKDKGVLFDGKDDKNILIAFNKIYSNQTIIGWNSKRFDIPLIWKRGILQKSHIFSNYQYLCNPYNDGSIDLMNVWNGAGNFGKMSECARLLGIPCKTGLDGSMIYGAWKAGEFEDIKNYNMQDCECTLAIYNEIYS